MRQSALLFLTAILLLSACNTEQSTQEQRWEDMMAVHDEVMPKMGEINRISRAIRAQMDTVPPIDTLLKLQQLDLLIRLGKAEESMMVWMNELEVLDDLRATKSHQEILRYIDSEKKRIDAVRDSMTASIQAGEAALGKE